MPLWMASYLPPPDYRFPLNFRSGKATFSLVGQRQASVAAYPSRHAARLLGVPAAQICHALRRAGRRRRHDRRQGTLWRSGTRRTLRIMLTDRVGACAASLELSSRASRHTCSRPSAFMPTTRRCRSFPRTSQRLPSNHRISGPSQERSEHAAPRPQILPVCVRTEEACVDAQRFRR